jgi:hypothetical protein
MTRQTPMTEFYFWLLMDSLLVYDTGDVHEEENQDKEKGKKEVGKDGQWTDMILEGEGRGRWIKGKGNASQSVYIYCVRVHSTSKQPSNETKN